MRQRELRLGRATHLTPDAAEVQKRKGTEEGQQRVSQSSVVLPTLTLGDSSPDQTPGRGCPRVTCGLWPKVSTHPPA